MTAVIECKDVKRTYVSGKIEVQALQGVSLNVSAGEFVSLGGLDRPNGGDVRVEDQWLNELSNSQLADLRMNRIGFVFQAYNLIPVLSAAENVGFIMQLQGKSTGERRRRAKQVLDSVGLSGMENRRPAELSGGQQQRVAVARAIASSPAIVLADEPTANLDSKASDALLQLLRQLNEEEGVTIVIASHDPKALEYARRHVRLVDGQIHSDA